MVVCPSLFLLLHVPVVRVHVYGDVKKKKKERRHTYTHTHEYTTIPFPLHTQQPQWLRNYVRTCAGERYCRCNSKKRVNK